MTDEYLEAVALGLFALGCPLSEPVGKAWAQLGDEDRASFRARARFVLSWADPSALDAGRSLTD